MQSFILLGQCGIWIDLLCVRVLKSYLSQKSVLRSKKSWKQTLEKGVYGTRLIITGMKMQDFLLWD